MDPEKVILAVILVILAGIIFGLIDALWSLISRNAQMPKRPPTEGGALRDYRTVSEYDLPLPSPLPLHITPTWARWLLARPKWRFLSQDGGSKWVYLTRQQYGVLFYAPMTLKGGGTDALH